MENPLGTEKPTTMSQTIIQKSLQNHFARSRVVFWYDAGRDWSNELDSLKLDGVKILTIDNDELATKFRVLRDEPSTKFLLYFPAARPDDDDNWLLDILLANAEFHADRASLHLNEVGLPPEFKNLVEEHGKFFQTKKNREALKKRLHTEDVPATVRRRQMAVLVQSPEDSQRDLQLRQPLVEGRFSLPEIPAACPGSGTGFVSRRLG